jgi:hypothetical protein
MRNDNDLMELLRRMNSVGHLPADEGNSIFLHVCGDCTVPELVRMCELARQQAKTCVKLAESLEKLARQRGKY